MGQPRVSVSRTADDKKTGMTIADLYQFLQETESAGIDVRTPAKVKIGWRGQIIGIEADSG